MRESFLDTFRQFKILKIQESWKAYSQEIFVPTSEFLTTHSFINTIKKKHKRGQIRYAQNVTWNSSLKLYSESSLSVILGTLIAKLHTTWQFSLRTIRLHFRVSIHAMHTCRKLLKLSSILTTYQKSQWKLWGSGSTRENTTYPKLSS